MLVYNEEMALSFYDRVFPQTDPFHTEFFCVAARKKYMTQEQKEKTNLGDTCMMAKTIIKEHSREFFLSKLHQVDASSPFFLDRDNNPIPQSCMTVYLNLNRTDLLKALKSFKGLLNDWEYDLLSALQFTNDNKADNLGRQLKTVQNNLLKAFQDPKNCEDKWLDIDCDIGTDFDAFSYKEKMASLLGCNDSTILCTHGGCHILIPKWVISAYNKILSEAVPREKMKEHVLHPERILSYVRDMMKDKDAKEIKLNQNLAVPLPGTRQGGFEVYFI